MAQPASRNEFKEYCLRQLGAPVLEINLATEQCDDIIDDAIQYFQEWHFDGVSQTFMKYRVSQDDIDRGRASTNGDYGSVGIVTETATANIAGTATTFSYYENSNYLQVPPEVIGVTKIYHFDGLNTATNNMFSVKYQLFLNDIYYWGSTETGLLSEGRYVYNVLVSSGTTIYNIANGNVLVYAGISSAP